MVLPLMAVQAMPYWMGAMIFVGVLGASMSTANGAMLVISVVLARNVFQRWSAKEYADSLLLTLSRVMAIPTAIAAALVAYWRPEPGILLVVAFDIVFAGCVVPLFAGVYWKRANASGALAAIAAGTGSRLIAHFITPAAYAGLDTLIPPVISALSFWTVCTLTEKSEASRHHVVGRAEEGFLMEASEG